MGQAINSDTTNLGLTSWRAQDEGDDETVIDQVYGKPFVRFNRFFKRMPFMPNFRESARSKTSVDPTDEADL